MGKGAHPLSSSLFRAFKTSSVAEFSCVQDPSAKEAARGQGDIINGNAVLSFKSVMASSQAVGGKSSYKTAVGEKPLAVGRAERLPLIIP